MGRNRGLVRLSVSCALCALAFAPAVAAFAPLPCNARKAIYLGWDTCGARTDDVYANRLKFAETGFDGIVMAINGKTADGRFLLARRAIDRRQWTYGDFAEAIPKIREMVALKGLRESYGLIHWMSSPRLSWGDDTGWERFAENMRVICRVAKESGLKGLFIDHEDYTGTPLFRWRSKDDPPYEEALAIARRRGALLFRAMAEAFPEGRMIFDRGALQLAPEVRSHNMAEAVKVVGDLWYPFLNGGLEALPPGVRFCDGNESTYDAVSADDYRALLYSCRHEALELIEPQLRQKYSSCLETCCAKYLDTYIKPEASLIRFSESLFGAGYLTDEVYWVYGEKHPIIDWGRTVHKQVDNTPWGQVFPDFARLLRVSVGDYSELRDLASKGLLTNLVSNSHCDARKGSVTPPPFREYPETKEGEPRFEYDAEDGCSRPGCLRKAGPGCYTVGVDRCLKEGDRIYVTLAAKAAAPTINVVWRSTRQAAKWEWLAGYQVLARPSADLGNGWKRYEVCALVPAEIGGVGLVLGGRASAESPVKFDDISIYRW